MAVSLSEVAVSDPNDFTISDITLDTTTGTTFTATFTGSNKSADTTTVPAFNLTVSYTGGSKTFTVGSRSVAENTKEKFTVS